MSAGQTNRIPNRPPSGETFSNWQHQYEQCQTAVIDSVRENPLAATMIVFGVGLGIGAMIGTLLVDSGEHRRRHLAHSLGQRMLNSVAEYMPDQLQQHLSR